MRIRKSSLILGAVGLAMFAFYVFTSSDVQELNEKRSLTSSELDSINGRIHKLEGEMEGNLEIMSGIKDKLNLLLELQEDPNNPIPALNDKPVIDKPKFAAIASVATSGTCPATVPLGHSNSQFTMNKFYEEWDFVDVDGGVWKQGWEIKTSDDEWKDTKLKVILMPHSHNDPGWVKTLDTYYQGQTKKILNVIVDNLDGHPKRKFVWAETIFLNMWFNDPNVDETRKQKFRNLLKNKQIEILTGGWVMTEEAPSHHFAMIDQLIEGHVWLDNNLEYHPKNGYNCDTFGATPTTAYLNQLSGIDHMLIQRTHYHVKKHFAQDHLLEFNWRQTFDNEGKEDILTHMMPFYSYDVPHTCGPDPAICCQFDFRRLRHISPPISCPWRIAPQEINSRNVDERAKMLLDQYRKKSKLFRKGEKENVQIVLTLLGDDFRMDSDAEAHAQFENYEKLFDYINSNSKFNAEVAFGTLADYFKLITDYTPVESFPSISGDFFSYSDRVDNYWTGFFNSRPYYKWFDRYLESWVQASDTLFSIGQLELSQSGFKDADELYSSIQEASRTLDLFQHHDAITGTEKDFVVRDYGDRLTKSMNGLQAAFAKIMGELLEVTVTLPVTSPVTRGALPIENVIQINANSCKYIAVYNSLLHENEDLVSLRVAGATAYVASYVDNEEIIAGQIMPYWQVQNSDSGFNDKLDSSSKKLVLAVCVGGLSTRQVKICGQSAGTTESLTSSNILTFNGALGVVGFDNEVGSDQDSSLEGINLRATLNPKNGLLKSLKSSEMTNEETQINLEFRNYGTSQRGDRSGAYLFQPDGPSRPYFGQESSAPFRIIRGRFVNEVHVLHKAIKHILTVNSFGLGQSAVSIDNYFNLKGMSNFELIMRFGTDVQSNGQFYSDLNGMTHSKRVYYSKLHLQGNVYPIVSSAYLQDSKKRVSLLTKQASGTASLQDGQLDVWLDRTLAQDDARGLGQPVVDNLPTLHQFRLVLEKRNDGAVPDSIYLSPYCNRLSEFLHSPLQPVILSSSSTKTINAIRNPKSIPSDAKLINLRPLRDKSSKLRTALIMRRYGADCSFSNLQNISNDQQWPISMDDLFGVKMDQTSLNTLTTIESDVNSVQIEPMKISTYLFK